VAAVLVAITWALINSEWIELPSYFFQTLIFLLFGTSILFVFLYKFDKHGFFVQLYLLTMAVKLVAYGTYNFVMILDDANGAAQNVVWFMMLYFIFTMVEIGFLYRKIINH
jgi:ABC-type multidrug transport system permease subunit